MENPGEGMNSVRTALSSYTLGPNVENLTFTGNAPHIGTGNELANVMTGGGGNDVLMGGAGINTAIYSGPASTYQLLTYAGTLAVLTSGADGDDRLQGIENIQFPILQLRQLRRRFSIPWECISPLMET